MTKHTILFLAANPAGTSALALDEEAHAIQVELERSGFRDRFNLEVRWASKPLDLLRELRRLRPSVVHYSGCGAEFTNREMALLDAWAADNQPPIDDAFEARMLDAVHSAARSLGESDIDAALASQLADEDEKHGMQSAIIGGDVFGCAGFAGRDAEPRDGLLLQAPDGQVQLITTEAICDTFRAAGSSVKLVVLSACYNEVQAEALSAQVDCVVGVRGTIGDDAARSFAVGFYRGLGECESVAAAFRQGCGAIGLDGLRNSDRPQLKARDGIDTTKLVLGRASASIATSSWSTADQAVAARLSSGREYRSRVRRSAARMARLRDDTAREVFRAIRGRTEDPRLKARGSGEPGRLKAPGRLVLPSADEHLASSNRPLGTPPSSFDGVGPSGLLKASPEGEGFSPSPSMDTEPRVREKPALQRAMSEYVDEVCLAATPWMRGNEQINQELGTADQPSGYNLIALLGRGGMGVVYRARQHNPPREVALKKLLAGEQATSEERRRFVTEIEAAARVRHPNIVEIYDVSRPDEPPYFTMPLFPSTLRAKLGQYRSPRAAATLISTIARAVRHAHKRGVLHRDLKPDNILIDEHGQPHVADFGLAKQVGDATLTAFGVGTPEYAAPEQLRNDRDAITTGVDQYSLGVMLYELLTGERPFRSNGDVLALLRAICETEPPPPSAHVPDLPRDLEAICLRSIARTPLERYDTVGAFADDLDRFLRGEPTVARPPGVVGRVRRSLWHHRLTVGLGGGALVLLAVISGSALNLAHEQERPLSQSTQEGYMYTAQAIASLVNQHLRRQEDQVVRLGNVLDQDDLRGLADAPSKPELQSRLEGMLALYLRDSHKGKKDGFDDIWLFDRRGMLVVQLPLPDRTHADKRGEDYSWRDYFQGARRIAADGGSTRGYVAGAFKAEITGTYKYGIAVPINSHGWEGVLMAAKGTTKDSSEFQLDAAAESKNVPETSIVAPCDRRRSEEAEGTHYCTVMHRRLAEDGESPHDDAPELHGPMPSSTDNYRDPITKDGDRPVEFAAFAQVKGTQFKVIVHHPPTRVISLAREMPRRIVLPVILALAAWAAIFGLGQRRIGRRRNKQVVTPVQTTLPAFPSKVSTVENK